MSDHRYRLGQSVRVTQRFPDRSGDGLYTVVRLLPLSPNGEFGYRIKGETGLERAVMESQLTADPELAGVAPAA